MANTVPLFDSLSRPPRLLVDGAVHLPGWLTMDTQARIVQESRDIARTVAGTPLAMQRPVVAGGQMSAYIMSLGRHWRTRPYGYVREMDGVAVPELPEWWAELARQAVESAAQVSDALAPWAEGFRPEVSLVNFYPPGAKMGMHVDDHELSNAPIVSLSIGDEAVFRIGGTEAPRGPWSDATLMSGDLVVFGGPARKAYHGVVGVRGGTGPSGTGLKQGRINVTIREVGA